MPSSKDRQRIEIPTEMYDRLKLIADSEERTLTGVVQDVLRLGLTHYQPIWAFRHYMSRFDEPAQGALALARDEAMRLHHNYIGTEHLLLGLAREEDGIAAQVLRQLWIEPDNVREAIVYITTNYGKKQPRDTATNTPTISMASGAEAAPSGEQSPAAPAETPGTPETPGVTEEVGYTARTHKVFMLAVDEAQHLHDDHIGTEHLLLAIEREGEGLAAGILQTLGALGKVRDFTLAEMQRRANQAEQQAALEKQVERAGRADGGQAGG